MSQSTIPPPEGGINPKAWYPGIRALPGFVDDAAQAVAIDELDLLWHQQVEFKDLCGGAHDQEDYLEISHRFPTVFVSHIPRLNAEHADEARRFTWLIDVLYDNNVRLAASAAAAPDQLYTDGVKSGEFSRTASRLTEIQTPRYLQLLHHSQGVTL
ncbi:MAG: AFG1/ZapE family ATPase [Gallionella sp.]